jgi:hypothetical protein
VSPKYNYPWVTLTSVNAYALLTFAGAGEVCVNANAVLLVRPGRAYSTNNDGPWSETTDLYFNSGPPLNVLGSMDEVLRLLEPPVQ